MLMLTVSGGGLLKCPAQLPELEVLNKGLNFTPLPSHNPVLCLIAVERCLSRIS